MHCFADQLYTEVIEVDERVLADGKVEVMLDESAVIAERLRELGTIQWR